MDIDCRGVRHVTVLVLLIGLSGGLAAHSAGQTTQPPPTQSTADRAASGENAAKAGPPVRAREASQLDPSGVAIKPEARAAAPGGPTAARASGKVGPAGKVLGKDGPSSPGGPGGVKDAAIERLGPGGRAARASNEQRGPDGTFNPPQVNGPGAATSSTAPSAPVEQQPVNEPVAKGGFQVFIDPRTGQITQGTDAQLQELAQQGEAAKAQQDGAGRTQQGDTAKARQGEAANQPIRPSEIGERPSAVGGGMMADIPFSLYPEVIATIGADGKVSLEERQAQTRMKDAMAHPPKVEQQSRKSEANQRLGPGGQQNATLDLPPAADVTVTIVNNDGAAEGFNDATAVAPVFGNSGTTRGAQRQNVFRAAAEYWGAILKSPVPIRINAQMNPQFCTATSAVLGSAGPTTVFRDFGGAPLASTWYVQATANSRAGADLDPLTSDINAQFNSSIDNPTCLGATSWWYGIGAPAPPGTVDFYTVVLHEIGHGIGFLSLVDLSTGAKWGGFDDAYERWLWDWSTGGWPGMTNAQRVASAVNTGQVIFWGPQATQAGRGLLTAGLNAGYPRVYAPNPVQGGSSISHFDTVLTPNELMEPAITPPPGPYAYMTSGALEDIGWKLLANGVFDYGGVGTWMWNHTDGWFQPTGANPTNLEGWNGNFVGVYGGTWLWNGTTQTWAQITGAAPTLLKACGNNLVWASAAFGTWRYNLTTGWAQLTAANPDSVECYGGNAAWESALGTWIYNFSTNAWAQITAANPSGLEPCGSRLVWWRSGAAGSDTWYWEAATGWHYLTIGPETTECYRGQLAWEGAAGPGTWLFNFTTGTWAQITAANPEQMLAWGPNLVWENAAFGTWIYDGAAWAQITTANPNIIETLGAELLWSAPGVGTWVWAGGGGGTGWVNITGLAAEEIVSTGDVK